jgi:acetate---CoA ligase (ADP-forming)
MFDLAAALERQPLPPGRRVAILSDGGGPGVLCAYACRAARLSVPPLSDSTKERLAAFLPPSTTIGNPLELFFASSEGPYAQAVETLLLASEVDALIAIHTPLDASDSAVMLEAIRRGTAAGRAAGGVGKPVLACLVAKDDSAAPIVLAGESIPTYAFPESAARVLGKVAAYAAWRAGPHGIIPDFDDIDPDAARAICRKAIEERGAGWLSAEEARAVLDALSLPVAPGGVARTADEAAQAGSGVEVRVSMAEDPSFGPLIAFSLGGIHVEVSADVSVRVTPLTDRAAAAMVREIRGYSLLEGYRGHPPADIEAIHNVLLRVSRLVEEVPDIAELEASPIFVGPPGEGCRIGDARIRVAHPRKGRPVR